MARVKGITKPGRPKAKDETSARGRVPDVYKDMLADAVSSASQTNDEGKVIKRRRVAGRVINQPLIEKPIHDSEVPDEKGYENITQDDEPAAQQTAYNESEDSAESDLDWEEVNFKEGLTQDASSRHLDNKSGELNLVLSEDHRGPRGQVRIRKAPVTAAEKQLRIETHKMHLLSLLVHIHLRNYWCNWKEIHEAVKSLLSSRTFSYLNPDEKQSQFQKSRSFIDGLKQASDAFREKFRINSRGMSRSTWAETSEAIAHIHLPRDLELPMQKNDFLDAAVKMEASRDVGAQIFCALLRSAGVEARLVCSLQPLPFNVTAIPTIVQKRGPALTVSYADGNIPMYDEESEEDISIDPLSNMPKPVGSTGPRSRFISGIQPRLSQTTKSHTPNSGSISQTRIDTKRIKESPHPIFWVEAFNEADQKWIPVDPVVTRTVSKPSAFEPPASDPQNNLTYVLAFEIDGSARDVTRRYAKAFNAKTRRGRLEAVPGGEIWWRRVMKLYSRNYDLPRDQIEESELAAREAAEPMPRNVLDFKDHPYYALERHLKRSEVIHPKRAVGTIAAGRSGDNQILEPVFRRRDVHVVKSGTSWYRLGREIKIGEQPQKHVPARRGKELLEDNDDAAKAGEESAGTALYAFDQTKEYSAPPVVAGRIPKNIYGNLDIYVPSMIPAGGVHIQHPETSRAARILGIDYADAVTGFAFRGRHGTAIITGAVVATSCRDAVEEVISAFETERNEEEENRRSLEALRVWKRFLVGLRIRERIQGYEIEGERTFADEIMRDGEEDADFENGGGFLPVPDIETTHHSKPIPSGDSGLPAGAYDEDGGGGFMLSDPEDGKDATQLSNYEISDLVDETTRQYDDRDQKSRPVASVFENIDESKDEKYKIQPQFERTDRNKLPIDEEGDSTADQSATFEANKLQVPLHQSTAKAKIASSPYESRSLHDDNMSLTKRSNYLSQTKKKSNPPLSPSEPYLSDTEMADAMALQQIHDTQSSSNQLPIILSADQKSNARPSRPRSQDMIASSSSVPVLPGQTLSPHIEADLDTVNPIIDRSPLQGGKEELEREEEEGKEGKELADEDESEDAGSLLSRDPSDEDAELDWLDY